MHSYLSQCLPYLSPALCCSVFANYQAQDGCSPTIGEQLQLEPFLRVIQSEAINKTSNGYGMASVHTTKEDLYARLWCERPLGRGALC